MTASNASGVVTSAMYACAVGMFAPAMPPTMRAMNSSGSDVATASVTYDRHEPSSPTRMMGFLPTRSDQRPQIGENRNCISEKLVPSSPISKADAPNDCA